MGDRSAPALVGLSPPALGAATAISPGAARRRRCSRGAMLCALSLRERTRAAGGGRRRGARRAAVARVRGCSSRRAGRRGARARGRVAARRRLSRPAAGGDLLALARLLRDAQRRALRRRHARARPPPAPSARARRTVSAAARRAVGRSRRRAAALGAGARARRRRGLAAVALAARGARARAAGAPRGRGGGAARAERLRRPVARRGDRRAGDRSPRASPGASSAPALPAAGALCGWGLRRAPRVGAVLDRRDAGRERLAADRPAHGRGGLVGRAAARAVGPAGRCLPARGDRRRDPRRGRGARSSSPGSRPGRIRARCGPTLPVPT